MIRKARVIGNALDAVIRIISLANVQSLHGTRNKMPLLGVLGVIAKIRLRTETCLMAQSSNEVWESHLQHLKVILPSFFNIFLQAKKAISSLSLALRKIFTISCFASILITPIFLKTLLKMAAAQNINNSTLRSILTILFYAQNEMACLMLASMSLELQKTFENYKAYDMIQELKTMFEEQVKHELFEMVKAFHACKQEDGQSSSSPSLKMKGYLDILERLGYPMPNELSVSLILNSHNKDYHQFVQNYNMHSMGKTIAELHAMLKLTENGLPKKAETLDILAIKGDKIQKDKKKPQGCKTHIYNTTQGLRRRRKLKHRALNLYVGNGIHATVEAIGSFNLILPNGLLI
ncbi:hypothetical protein Tco_1159602, partial [Tanacetum coccineum]